MTCPEFAFVPAPVQLLGYDPELDDEVAREVLRLSLATLLLSKAAAERPHRSP